MTSETESTARTPADPIFYVTVERTTVEETSLLVRAPNQERAREAAEEYAANGGAAAIWDYSDGESFDVLDVDATDADDHPDVVWEPRRTPA